MRIGLWQKENFHDIDFFAIAEDRRLDAIKFTDPLDSKAKQKKGEICMSEDVYKSIRNKVDIDAEFIGRKAQKCKGTDRFIIG